MNPESLDTSTREMSATGVWSQRDTREASAQLGREETESFVNAAVTFIEKWKDKKVFDEHCAMPYIANFFDNVRPGLVDRFEVKLYEEILP